MRLFYNPAKQRVNIVVKDHVLRFSYNDSNSMDAIQYYGEYVLPSGLIKEGRVQDAAAFSAIMEEMVEEYKWKGKRLYFCVPDASVVIKEHKAPSKIEASEMKGYLYMQLGEGLHLPFDNPVFDFHIIEEGEESTHILLFAYPEEHIRLYERVFEEVKLKPKAADISSLSLYRLFEESGVAAAEDHIMCVQWNIDGCVVSVFHEHRPIFTNYMTTPLEQSSFAQMGDALAPLQFQGEFQDVDAYIHDQLMEIERLMDFYRYSVSKGKASITNVIMIGDFPNIEGIVHRSQERFSVPVNVLEPKHFLDKDGNQLPATLAETIGLAIKP